MTILMLHTHKNYKVMRGDCNAIFLTLPISYADGTVPITVPADGWDANFNCFQRSWMYPLPPITIWTLTYSDNTSTYHWYHFSVKNYIVVDSVSNAVITRANANSSGHQQSRNPLSSNFVITIMEWTVLTTTLNIWKIYLTLICPFSHFQIFSRIFSALMFLHPSTHTAVWE